ncbi:trehalose-phosphatase [Streptomyces sp. P38-E01]|uniref:Trehalose 6-phosphate phosphatase n=1 Tax=Streptomyces tardus TaxID=2780544 RepID=A0A949N0S9_9ACTN|nr:trehalose-phosphatase [Streptomyces tardus]MBU7597035.1 trehalose-phosphatase [Streptomyces tardus]
MGPLPIPVTAAGRTALDALLAHPADSVLAFDFDGTLSPIVPDPADARVHPGVLDALARLAPRMRAVAVITGRPARTAVEYGSFAKTAGLERLTVLGAYGAERWDAATGELRLPPPHPGIDAVRAELPDLLRRLAAPDGTATEDKGYAVAVHTRRTQDPAGTFDRLREPVADLAARHELHLEPGRFVLEVRPAGMDKGAALRGFLAEAGPPPDTGAVLYGGDDLGDLPAYEAVLSLRSGGLPGLLVCSGDPHEIVAPLIECADLTLDGPQGVAAFLAAVADHLAAHD